MDERMDGRSEIHPCPTGHWPFGAAAQKETNHLVKKPPLIPVTNQQPTNLTNDLVVTHRLHAKGKVCH